MRQYVKGLNPTAPAQEEFDVFLSFGSCADLDMDNKKDEVEEAEEAIGGVICKEDARSYRVGGDEEEAPKDGALGSVLPEDPPVV